MAQRYTAFARLLHWTIAALVFAQIGLGIAADRLDRVPAQAALDAHVQVGLLILVLAVLRLLWRATHRPPPLPPALLGAWHRRAAHTAHWMLYGLLLVLPLSGYALWIWDGDVLSWFGGPVLPVPDMTGQDEYWRSLAGYTHEYAVYALAALLVLHIGAAIGHEIRGTFRPIRDRMT